MLIYFDLINPTDSTHLFIPPVEDQRNSHFDKVKLLELSEPLVHFFGIKTSAG